MLLMVLYVMLSILAALVALLVACVAVYVGYLMWFRHDRSVLQAFSRWTLLDTLFLGVFVAGLLFLLADAVGVIRDREAYPYYHYGYLLSGFVYNLLGGLFLFLRLGATLRLVNHQHAEPDQTQNAKERI
jgi:hypothetical protein